MDPKSHWEKVYRTKQPNEVSWYRPHLDVSLRLIEEAAPGRDAQIVDVGGGESTLVDDLLAREYRRLSILDVSSTALHVAKERLGANADSSSSTATATFHDDLANRPRHSIDTSIKTVSRAAQ